ncbi:arylalkylamine N-acetyltransferase 1-like isoform X2 [Diabrotica undecimpunctata]|uniref:arylalkylamine N-acetyltransferase 1-like isoform X2 n=1 Tax=Diabrotica undecimpunctata TaxID=50387 RepID=UPI003B635308
MTEKPNIVIRTASLKDKEQIKQHLRLNFYKDEPCCKSMGVVAEGQPLCENLENYFLLTFGKGLDLVAECDGKIVGVCLNVLMERGVEETPFVATDEKCIKIKEFLDHIFEEVNIFERYPDVNKAINLLVLSVEMKYRHLGIGRLLCTRTIELAKTLEAKLVMIECTSIYSAAAVKSLDFQLVWKSEFDNYKVNNEVVFKTTPPHNIVQTLIYEV